MNNFLYQTVRKYPIDKIARNHKTNYTDFLRIILYVKLFQNFILHTNQAK